MNQATRRKERKQESMRRRRICKEYKRREYQQSRMQHWQRERRWQPVFAEFCKSSYSSEARAYILPTNGLRLLLMRNLNRLRRGDDRRYNYVVFWNDVRGFGISMSHAEWVGDGLYVND